MTPFTVHRLPFTVDCQLPPAGCWLGYTPCSMPPQKNAANFTYIVVPVNRDPSKNLDSNGPIHYDDHPVTFEVSGVGFQVSGGKYMR